MNRNKTMVFTAFLMLLNTGVVYADIAQENSFLIPGITSYTRLAEQPILLSTGPQQPWSFTMMDMPYARNLDLLSLACTSDNCVTVGFYEPYANVTMQEPLILSNTEQNWHFIKKIENLPIINFGAFTSITCNTNKCFIAGYYDNFNSHQTPVLLVAGKGRSWKVVNEDTMALPKDIANSNLFAIKCLDEKTCFAGGNYITKNKTQSPFILSTLDNGKSWSTANLSAFPANKAASLVSLACNSHACFAGGYFVNKFQKPILLSTFDKGSAWNSISPSIFPADMQNGIVTKVKCSGTTCVALGSYSTQNIDYKPLVLISTNGGTNWKLADDHSGLTHINYLELKDVSCRSETCTIVGSYNSADSIQHPLILNLATLNYEWGYKRNTDFSFNKEDQSLNVISCKNNECIASGDASQFPKYKTPLVIKSENTGITWSRVNNFENMIPGIYTRFKAIA